MHPEQWLLIEWPAGDADPLKYYLSTLPDDITLNDLVAKAHMRSRIERDYQDLKQELGLGHYEGRGWRGFHHHATLSIAAYGFLVTERINAGKSAGAKKLRHPSSSCASCGLHPSRQPIAHSGMCQTHSPQSVTSSAFS